MLRDEFERRRRSNPRYSLRGFALLLGIDSATLSQVLRGRRRLSPRATAALCDRLALAQPQRDAVICEALRAGHERRILRQVGRDGFTASSRALARRLRLRTDEINAALVRLLRERKLRMLSPARWVALAPEQR
jgi:DNA-binding transcriptional regulator YdaS (Cro superfamily)